MACNRTVDERGAARCGWLWEHKVAELGRLAGWILMMLVGGWWADCRRPAQGLQGEKWEQVGHTLGPWQRWRPRLAPTDLRP